MKHSRIATLASVLAVAATGLGVPMAPVAQAAPVPGPSLTAPADETSTIRKDVVLQWTPVEGALSYQVQLGISDAWSDSPVLDAKTVSPEFVPPVTLPHASYFWRVRATTAQGRTSWSASRSFNRGWSRAQAPTTVSLDRHATFTWTPVPRASFYELQVSSRPTLNDPPYNAQADAPVDTCFTTHTSVTPYVGAPNEDAVLPGDCTMAHWTFSPGTLYWRVRAHDGTGAPTDWVTGGVNRTGLSVAPPLDWVDPDGDDLVSPCHADSVSKCVSTGASEAGAWSAPSSFTFPQNPSTGTMPDYRTMPAPTGVAISNGGCVSTTCSDTPTISWAPVTDAVRYRVSLYLDESNGAPGNVFRIWETPFTSVTPSEALRDYSAGTGYHVAVQACTVAGCSTYPGTTSFLKRSRPVVHEGGSLPDGAVFNSPTPLLTWADYLTSSGGADTQGARLYRVQVTSAGDPDFDAPTVNTVTDATRWTPSGQSLTDPALPDGSFIWRVQAIDESGHSLRWSDVRSFTRDTVAPGLARLALTDSGPAAPLAIELDEPVVVAPAVTVTDAMGTAVAGSVSGAGTQWSFTPASPWLLGATYSVLVAGAADAAGNVLVARSLSMLAHVGIPLVPPTTGSGEGAPGTPAPAEPVPGDEPGTPVVEPVKDVRLDWVPVPGATSYQVQVGTTDDWSNDPVLEVTTVSSEYTPLISLPHATYNWRVRAVGAELSSDWSPTRTFTKGWDDAPTLLQPSGAFPAGEFGRFVWTPVEHASFYELQLSDDPEFGASRAGGETENVDTCFSLHTTITPLTGMTGKESTAGDCIFKKFDIDGSTAPLYWRVRAHDAAVGASVTWVTGAVRRDGLSTAPWNTTLSPVAKPATTSGDVSAWSATTSYTPASTTPASTVGTYPAAPRPRALAGPDCSTGTCSDSPTIRWQPVAGALAYRVTLYLDATRTGAPRNVQRIWDTPFTSVTPPEVLRDYTAGKGYRVAIQSCVQSRCSASASTLSFRKLSRPVALEGPAAGAGLGLSQPDTIFTWQDYLTSAGGADTLGAQEYELQITKSSDPGFAGEVQKEQVEGNRWAPTTTALADGSYLWRVRAVPSGAGTARWSAVRGFVRDTVRPTASFSLKDGFDQAAPLGVTFSEPVKGKAANGLVARIAGSRAALSAEVSGSGTAWALEPQRPWVTGQSYAFEVSTTLTDLVGNPAVPVTTTLRASRTADTSGVAVQRGGRAWRTVTASDAKGKSYFATSRKGVMKTVLVGKSVKVIACRSPKGGLLRITVDGKPRAAIDLFRPWSGCGPVWSTKVSAGKHVVSLRATGTGSRSSRGSRVGVDAVATS